MQKVARNKKKLLEIRKGAKKIAEQLVESARMRTVMAAPLGSCAPHLSFSVSSLEVTIVFPI